MIDIFSNTKIPTLEKLLNTYSQRQNAIASNIANANTPGYKRLEVKFEEKLSQAINGEKLEMASTDPMHFKINSQDIESIEPEVINTPEGESNSNGINNVDIDQENVLLAQNQIAYRMASRMMSRQFKGIQEAIKGSVT